MSNKNIGELIPIESKNGQQAVNARHLYAWLEIKKDFSNWIKAQIRRCDLVENADYQSFAQKGEREIGGTTRIEYALSLNAAKEISMMSQTERGKQARRYFIECERQLRDQRAVISSDTSRNLPMTYKEALQQLLLQVEENERLQSENSLMLPKARIYDQVMQTPEESWLSTTSAVANEIGMSAQKLNRMLCACGIIYKTPSGEFLFCSEYLSWNLGKTVSCVVNEEKGQIRTYIKWTTRGRAYIHALYDCDWNKRRAWHMLKSGKEVAAL